MSRGALGGGAREYAPGDEEWMRLEAQPVVHQDAFAEDNPYRAHRVVPMLAWPLLAASVLSISSAGAVFAQMRDVPPVTLAAWRLQLASVLLFVGAVWQWHKHMRPEERAQTLASWRLLGFSGVCLTVHFGAWVWSLEHTSLAHSLLFVCSVPVLIALGTCVLRQPISATEVLGSIVAFGGGLLLALGPRGTRESGTVTVAGDMAALLAAVVFIGYLSAGRTLRQWMPVFVYAFPVTGLAALLLTLAAALFEGAKLFTGGAGGLLGWLAVGRYAGWITYLAVFPGIVGHTGFNTLLRWLTPLTVSLAFQLEPAIGTLLGWMSGVVAAPGWATWVGGLIVLGATCVVTIASTRREARKEAKGQAQVELENVFAGEQLGLLAEQRHVDGGDDERSSNGSHRHRQHPHVSHYHGRRRSSGESTPYTSTGGGTLLLGGDGASVRASPARTGGDGDPVTEASELLRLSEQAGLLAPGNDMHVRHAASGGGLHSQRSRDNL